MKIECWAVGKPNEPYISQGVKDFTDRIQNYYPMDWRLVSLKKNSGSLSPLKLKQDESDMIMSLLKPDDYLVSLDEHGKTMTSRNLSTFLQARGNDSVKKLIFLIGGAYGLDEPLLRRSRYIWSLSTLTFPHQLVRLILAEQIYRACSIGRNEKYHHD